MAFGTSTFSGLSGAVSDIFGGQSTAAGLRIKAQGSRVEAENYDLASDLATKNASFADTSMQIKVAQADRSLFKSISGQAADVAGAGFAASGSALDLLRDSASQGALTTAVAGQQGLIAVEGYEQQAKSYNNLAEFSRWAADQEDRLASSAESNSWITGGLKLAASVGTLFGGK